LDDRTRGAFIAAVFAMQGTGILCAGAVGCIVSAIYNHWVPVVAFSVDPVASVPDSADFVWRAILMFGAVPAVATYYYRMKMPETARFTGEKALVCGIVHAM
jgi:PHS family inorganic phosphate transporter-like MFS transporter